MKHHGERAGHWDKMTEPTVELYAKDSSSPQSVDVKFNTINMCAPTHNNMFGRNGMDIDSEARATSTNTAGRCTLRDVSKDPGLDFVASSTGHASNTVPRPAEITSETCVNGNCPKSCNTFEFAKPSRYEYAKPRLVDDKLVYVGQQYAEPAAVQHYSARRKLGVCHRIDSDCVTGQDANKNTNIKNLFLQSGVTKHPVDLRYEQLGRHAYTQINGRMLSENSGHPLPSDMSDAAKTRINAGMFARNVGAGALFSSWQEHNDLWISKDDSPVQGRCGLSKIRSHSRFKVVPYVLNPALQTAPDKQTVARFSHLIYNDRILMERGYSANNQDVTSHVQQLFGHHFERGTKTRMNPPTSPTPSFSYCPVPNTATDNNNLHKFKLVKMDHGKTRMLGRQHRWDQDTKTDGTLKRKRGVGKNRDHPPSMAKIFTNTANLDTGKESIFLSEDYWQIGAYIGAFLYTRFVWTDFEAHPTAPGILNPVRYPDNSDGDGNLCQPIASEFQRHRLGFDMQNRGDIVYDNKTFDTGRLGSRFQNDFFAVKQTPLHELSVCRDLPAKGASWDLHQLAMCYEQNPTEPSNLRPWWSTTACDMIQNFMDRGTSFDFLNTLFRSPFSFSTDTGDTWRTNRKMPRGPLSLLYWYSFQENRYSTNMNGYKWKDEDQNSPGSPREVMYLPDQRLSHYEKDNSDAHTWKNKMVDTAGLKNIDSLTRIFSFNMLYDSVNSLVPSQSRTTRPLAFSACENSGLGYFARTGYCDEEVVTPKMLVTKPSMWSHTTYTGILANDCCVFIISFRDFASKGVRKYFFFCPMFRFVADRISVTCNKLGPDRLRVCNVEVSVARNPRQHDVFFAQQDMVVAHAEYSQKRSTLPRP